MKRRKTSSLCSLLLAVICWLSAVGCSSDTPKDASSVDEYPQIYPDYIGVTIPVDIAPLNFSMLSDSIALMDVEVKGSKGGSLHANGEYADFDIGEWHRLLTANRGDSLTVTVCARQDGRWTRYRDFTLYVSPDSIGAWGITYRRIAPGYQLFGPMGLYQRRLSTFEESALIENSQLTETCLNCHTANRTNPDQYVFHARVDHGGTVISRQGRLEVLQSKNDSLGGAMVYPYWHPGGRYCAFSTNKTSQMFHLSGPKRIEVYDSSSDVFVYDKHHPEGHTHHEKTVGREHACFLARRVLALLYHRPPPDISYRL